MACGNCRRKGTRTRAQIESDPLSVRAGLALSYGVTCIARITCSLPVNEDTPLPNVAIIGRPNVGKSALFTRLARRKIGIVHDQPGITRDRISAPVTRGSTLFTIWDTGG